MSSPTSTRLNRTVGTWGVFVAGVALVVASSTLVTDFAGFVALGWGFAIALVLAFLVIVPLALSVADVSVAYPSAGAIYHFAQKIIGGRRGTFAGVFLAFCFFGMFLFSASGETTAGAYALRSLCGSELPVEVFVVVLAAAAVVPNVFGMRTAAGITAALLVVMLGIRWFFGLAGFFGWAGSGAWSAANLVPEAGFCCFGPQGIVSFGLALGFWTFVGIEGACSLAEEAKHPARSIPRGMLLGLLAILTTSLVMGIGATGTMPLPAWREIVNGPLGNGGESPQLAFGEVMFGAPGRLLMAISSLAATLSTLTVAFAAVSRMLFGIARDGHFFGRLSPVLARVNPRTGGPLNALLFVVGVYLMLAVCTGAVIDCLYSAAYLWIFRYVVLHVLAVWNRVRHPDRTRAFRGRWFVPCVVLGMAGAFAAFYFGFAGQHLVYAPRALGVTLVALAITAISYALSPRSASSASAAPRSQARVDPIPASTGGLHVTLTNACATFSIASNGKQVWRNSTASWPSG